MSPPRYRNVVRVGFLRGVLIACTALILLPGCGSDADSSMAPTTATVKVRVVQMSYQSTLPRYKGLADDTPADVVLGMNSGAAYSDGPSFSGYAIVGVALPALSGWGVTPWIDVPAGRHLVPFLPDNTGNPQLKQFDFVAGTEVSFVLRDFNLLPWEAVPLPVATAVPPDQIELGVLNVATVVNDAGSAGSLSNRLRVEIVAADDTVLVRRDTYDSTLLRLTAAPFRVNVYELEASGKRLFRSEPITLAGGTRWSGSLFLRDRDSAGRSLVFYADKSSQLVTSVDERAELQIINLSLFDLPLHIPQPGLAARQMVTVPRHSSLRTFSLASAEARVDWEATTNPIDGPSVVLPAGSALIPKIAAGRGYTLIFLEGATNRAALRPVGFAHQYSNFGAAELTCLNPRVLNALVVPETPANFSFQVMETALYQSNQAVITAQLPILPTPLGTLMVGQGRSCNARTTTHLLATMTVAVAPPGSAYEFSSAALHALPQRSSGSTSVDSGKPLSDSSRAFVSAVNIITAGSGRATTAWGTGDFR